MDGKGFGALDWNRESRPWSHCCNQRVFSLWTQGIIFVFEIVLNKHSFASVAFNFTLNYLFQEKGNQYVKMGKKHYSDAIDCYTRAINQKALSDSETSILFSNRALVNLLLGNFRRALNDANDALKLLPSNIKVCTVLTLWVCLLWFFGLML